MLVEIEFVCTVANISRLASHHWTVSVSCKTQRELFVTSADHHLIGKRNGVTINNTILPTQRAKWSFFVGFWLNLDEPLSVQLSPLEAAMDLDFHAISDNHVGEEIRVGPSAFGIDRAFERDVVRRLNEQGMTYRP